MAAAEPVGDVGLLWRALELLEIAMGMRRSQPRRGWVDRVWRSQVRFRHPLVRSAVYRVAAADDRRRAHQTLAEGDRSSRSIPTAAHGIVRTLQWDPMRTVARQRGLGRPGASPRRPGRHGCLLGERRDRADCGTPAGGWRGTGALAAAQAKFEAAAPDAASEWPRDRGTLPHRHAAARATGATASPDHVRCSAGERRAATAARCSPAAGAARGVGLARETHLEALGGRGRASRRRRWAGGRELREAAEAARATPRGRGPPGAVDCLVWMAWRCDSLMAT